MGAIAACANVCFVRANGRQFFCLDKFSRLVIVLRSDIFSAAWNKTEDKTLKNVSHYSQYLKTGQNSLYTFVTIKFSPSQIFIRTPCIASSREARAKTFDHFKKIAEHTERTSSEFRCSATRPRHSTLPMHAKYSQKYIRDSRGRHRK